MSPQNQSTQTTPANDNTRRAYKKQIGKDSGYFVNIDGVETQLNVRKTFQLCLTDAEQATPERRTASIMSQFKLLKAACNNDQEKIDAFRLSLLDDALAAGYLDQILETAAPVALAA